ncbi:transmembrane protein [Rhizoctonia solani]|uniref:Transmembrane protein n=1 Tax=Rhizoctonia solani TaxID=456999 RepID=A0A8H8T0I1_9AGAM|nr:uncharacterized protein RhiXN_07370 [Rhizoctonia solani]QRW25421.1 transmembrane protein [Rhizoctonia solani]
MWPTFKTEHPFRKTEVLPRDIKLATLAFGFTFWLKFAVAAWIGMISISVYCIWLPAKLQISETYIRLNWYWDHIEKILYLLTDAALNMLFIRLIRQRLLKKFDKLVAMNLRMIFVSLSMDIIIIGMLSYRNELVYMQFHPVAFMVKLEIEMCMSRLIVKVARGTGIDVKDQIMYREMTEGPGNASGRGVSVHVTTQVITRTDNSGADYEFDRGTSISIFGQSHSALLSQGTFVMPPRSKRKRPAAPARLTRSKAQAPQTPDEQAVAEPSKSTSNEEDSVLDPSARQSRPRLIMVVLPASKRPTPKTSSALSPVSPDPSNTMSPLQICPIHLPSKYLNPHDSRPQKCWEREVGRKRVLARSLLRRPANVVPSSRSQMESFIRPCLSTPTPSPSSRDNMPEPMPPSPHPSSPSAGVHPELEVVHSGRSQTPEEVEINKHKPPTSPAPYSDTVSADDPFGFLAAETRLRERRIQMGIDDIESGPQMPSSGGPEAFDQSVYEEAFASIFYDPQTGTVPLPSEAESRRTRLKRKHTMEVVIPTNTRGKEKPKQDESMKDASNDPSPKSKPSKRTQKGKEKAKEPVLTTYELEAMLPHRIKRVRKPRTKDEENITLSDVDSEEPSSPKKSRAASTRKKAGQSVAITTKKGSKAPNHKYSKAEKPTGRQSKRIRGGEMADTDETRKRFEIERKRRLEAYKALDTYTLEEEEVVW